MLQYTPSYLSHILIQAVADGGHGVSQGGGGGVGGRGKREWGVAVRGGIWPSMGREIARLWGCRASGSEKGENENSYRVTHYLCIDIP